MWNAISVSNSENTEIRICWSRAEKSEDKPANVAGRRQKN